MCFVKHWFLPASGAGAGAGAGAASAAGAGAGAPGERQKFKQLLNFLVVCWTFFNFTMREFKDMQGTGIELIDFGVK